MKLLIDSHVFLWLLYTPEKINQPARHALDSAEAVSLSLVSLWELTIKFTHGKLPSSPTRLWAGVRSLGIEELGLKQEHIAALPNIKLPHKDPFDRLLIAQSEVEGCRFVTADKHLQASKYRTIGA